MATCDRHTDGGTGGRTGITSPHPRVGDISKV